MYRKILKVIGLLMALTLAVTVAYVSVTGLMKVFSGVGVIGLTFFISIEVGKVVVTSLVHTFRKRLNILIKFIATIMVLVAMLVTSLGCYGFLSSSYKKSFIKLENTEAEITLLEKRKEGYQLQLDIITNEKTSINKTITDLTKGLSNNVIQYVDPESGEIITTTSSTTRRVLTAQLDRTIDRQSNLNTKSDTLSSKIFIISNNILETKLGNDASNELGPLKYLSDVSDMSMDDVMKWFILFLIFIGDPLAILLVIIYNKIIEEEEIKEKKPSIWKRLFKKKENTTIIEEDVLKVKWDDLENSGLDDKLTAWEEFTASLPEEPLFNVGEVIEQPPILIEEIVEDRPSKEFIEELVEEKEVPLEEYKLDALNRIKESMGEQQTFVNPPPLTQPAALDLTKQKEVETPFVEKVKPRKPTNFRLKNLQNRESQYHKLLEESDSNDEVVIPKKKEEKFTFDVVEEKKVEEEVVINLEQLVIPPEITKRRRPGSGYMGIRRV